MGKRPSQRSAWLGLALVLEAALWLRILAANAVSLLVERRGLRWLFPDTDIYWQLGLDLWQRRPFEVMQWGVPHFALRTPGYPLFLAACMAIVGDQAVPVRLVQAFLGAATVGLVFLITRQVLVGSMGHPRAARAGLVAAALCAVDPYAIGFSVVLLSEALFTPLMLAGLWGQACLWEPGVTGGGDTAVASGRGSRCGLIALGAGAAWGLAILAKPSFALFPPLSLAAWVVGARKPRRGRAMVSCLLIGLGLCVVQAPWWVRNARVYGRFVPTAMWSGASLYDGLNPSATGASDMRFLADPDIWPLDEEAQDRLLMGRAVSFARSHPGQAAALAWSKALRYGSLSPGPALVSSPVARGALACWTLFLYLTLLAGVGVMGRNARVLVLLAGPLVYFAMIHLAFASSIRYRVPGMMVACGLVAVGVLAIGDGRAVAGRAELTERGEQTRSI